MIDSSKWEIIEAGLKCMQGKAIVNSVRTARDRRMSFSWIPNAISLLRVALVAPILLLILNDGYAVAIVLFCVAGFSDGVDGYLAKRFGWRTRLGALLDPIADKLLVAGLFITLAYIQLIPTWLASVVIFRDLVIISGATAYNFIVGPVQGEPTRISKLNTALELLFLLIRDESRWLRFSRMKLRTRYSGLPSWLRS